MTTSKDDLSKLVDEFVFKDSERAEPKAEAKPAKPLPPDFDASKPCEAMTAVGAVPIEKTKTVKYSELFGWSKTVLKDSDGKEMEDFDVVVYDDEHWDADGLANVPKKDKFKGRVIDHRAVYPFVLGMQPQFRGFKIMMVGPTGSGKSTLAEHYCAMVNQPFLRINGRQDMESDTLLGKPWVSEDSMEYKIGEWPKASKAGWFVLVDEPFKIPSGIWMTAQRHLERGGIWQLDDMPTDNVLDKQIVPKSSYRCVLADNVVGTGDNVEQYGATMIQDSSTLNRIDMVITVDYLKPAQEANIITKAYPAIPKHMATKMISLLNLLRAGFDSGELSSPASIRNIEAWSEMTYKLGGDYAKAFQWILLNRYADDTEAGAVRNHYFTVFGKHLSK